AAVTAGGPGAGPKPQPSRHRALEWFSQLSAAARLRLVERLPGAAAEDHTVTRGNVTPIIPERGIVAAADCAEIVFRVKAPGTVGKGDSAATTVKWVIDAGATVKKGDKLVELDDSRVREKLAEQVIQLDMTEAAHAGAVAQRKLAETDGKVDVRLA